MATIVPCGPSDGAHVGVVTETGTSLGSGFF
jgi:hypothetical protein